AIRYNTILHRYEFTSLVWDIANQQFVTSASGTPAVIVADHPLNSVDLGSDAHFTLVMTDNSAKTTANVTLPRQTPNAAASVHAQVDGLVVALNAALKQVTVGTSIIDITDRVVAGRDNDRLTFLTQAAGAGKALQISYALGDAAAKLGF